MILNPGYIGAYNFQSGEGDMSELDTTGFKDKDSRKPEYRELYERLPFIEAYAKHTDMRIAAVGPELAIGAKKDGQQDWDIHGKQQLDFLISNGLMPKHTLLDIGCGTGRLACKAIPYLDVNKYTGIEISFDAFIHCINMAKADGLREKMSVFVRGDGTLERVKLDSFDYVWAHSVFTHLPPDIIEQMFRTLSVMDFGQFFFTHKQSIENKRTGLKQFSYDPNWFRTIAHPHGMIVDQVDYDFPAGQHVMRVWRR